MKLYDFPQSPNCRKVRMYLAEKHLTVALQPVNLLSSFGYGVARMLLRGR